MIFFWIRFKIIYAVHLLAEFIFIADKISANTAAVFDDEGYFKTGDYGKLDEEGWIYITGRLKNLIILSNGKNVYPEEIETEMKKVNSRMVSYKAVKMVKIRDEEFKKNTSKKILRFVIDKSIE